MPNDDGNDNRRVACPAKQIAHSPYVIQRTRLSSGGAYTIGRETIVQERKNREENFPISVENPCIERTVDSYISSYK